MERKYRRSATIIPLRKELHRLKTEFRKDLSDEEFSVWEEAFNKLAHQIKRDWPASKLHAEFIEFDLFTNRELGLEPPSPPPKKKPIVKPMGSWRQEQRSTPCKRCGGIANRDLCGLCQITGSLEYRDNGELLHPERLSHSLRRQYDVLLPTLRANVQAQIAIGRIPCDIPRIKRGDMRAFDRLGHMLQLLDSHCGYTRKLAIKNQVKDIPDTRLECVYLDKVTLRLTTGHFIDKWLFDLAQATLVHDASSPKFKFEEDIKVMLAGLNGDITSVYRYIGLLQLEQDYVEAW